MIINVAVPSALTLDVEVAPVTTTIAVEVSLGGVAGGTFADIVGLPSQNTALAEALDLKADLDSPTLTTPTLGIATVTSVNKLRITPVINDAVLQISDGRQIRAGSDIVTHPQDGGISTSLSGAISTGIGGQIYTNDGGFIATSTGGYILTGNGGFLTTSTASVSFANTSGNPITITAPVGGSTATLPAGASVLASMAELDLKANLASPTFTGTVSGVTAAMVGLGNVTNTSDAAKPVSTAQQTALNLKANLASPTFTGTVTASTGFSGNGSQLTNLNALNIASGTVSPERLGSGSGGSTKFLREDGTWQPAASTPNLSGYATITALNDGLSGKANLAGGNTFSGLQNFESFDAGEVMKIKLTNANYTGGIFTITQYSGAGNPAPPIFSVSREGVTIGGHLSMGGNLNTHGLILHNESGPTTGIIPQDLIQGENVTLPSSAGGQSIALTDQPSGQVNLETGVVGVLPIANGGIGLGAATLTQRPADGIVGREWAVSLIVSCGGGSVTVVGNAQIGINNTFYYLDLEVGDFPTLIVSKICALLANEQGFQVVEDGAIALFTGVGPVPQVVLYAGSTEGLDYAEGVLLDAGVDSIPGYLADFLGQTVVVNEGGVFSTWQAVRLDPVKWEETSNPITQANFDQLVESVSNQITQTNLDQLAESANKLVSGIRVTGATGALADLNGVYYAMGNHTSNPSLYPNESPITRPYFTKDSSGATFPNDAGGVDGNGYILFYWQLNDNWVWMHNGTVLAYSANLDAGQDPMQLASWNEVDTGNDLGITLTRFYPQSSFANLAGSPDDNPSMVQNVLLKSGNLSGLYFPSTARTNLGLGTGNNVQFGGILSTPISGSTGSFTTLAASGVTTMPAGTQANAALQFGGVANTGFYVSSGQLLMEKGGVVGLYLNNSSKTVIPIAAVMENTLNVTGLATLSGGVSTTTLAATGNLTGPGFKAESGTNRTIVSQIITNNAGEPSCSFGSNLNLASSSYLAWNNSAFWNGSPDLFLNKGGPASLQLGQNHASVTTPQTIKAHDITGTTGVGAAMTIAGGKGGTTSGAGGAVIIATSATNGALVPKLTVGADGSTSLSGTLNVTGATTLSNGLIVTAAGKITANGQGALASLTDNDVVTKLLLQQTLFNARESLLVGVTGASGQTTSQYAFNHGSLAFNGTPTVGDAGIHASFAHPNLLTHGTSLLPNSAGIGPIIDWRLNHMAAFALSTPIDATARDVIIRATVGACSTSGTSNAKLGVGISNASYGIRIEKHPVNNSYLLRLSSRIGLATANVTGATNTSPITITHGFHGHSNGDQIELSGILGNTAANGVFIIANVTTNTFDLVGSVGNGTYTSGGGSQRLSVDTIELQPAVFYKFFFKWNYPTRTVSLHLGLPDAVASLSAIVGVAGNIAMYQTAGGLRVGFYSVTSAIANTTMQYEAPKIFVI